MKDPYEILGVERTASEAAIQSAYRKLAKRHHPDVNPGKPEAEEKFKEIASAYALLSDSEKRARFDRGEIDASGAERSPERSFYRNYGNDAARTKYRAAGNPGGAYRGDINLDDLDLESIFGDSLRGRAQHGPMRAKGYDMRYALTVDFLDAAKGAVKRLTLPDGSTLDVTVPAGLKDGQVLRLKGKGEPGIGPDGNSGPPGDALIEVSVAPHPYFRRDGNDVVLDLPITLKEAVRGAKIEVPTLSGPVTITVPPKSIDGKRLRLRGRGIAGGNQDVLLKVVLPSEDEPELAAFLEGWSPQHPFDPRAGLKS